MRPLFAHLSDQQIDTYRLVLDAGGIPCRVSRRPRGWIIETASAHRSAAVRAVRLYLQENAAPPPSRPPLAPVGKKTFSALYAVLCLVTLHGALRSEFERQVFIEAYGADAAAILHGQIYRCFTALLFHADWAHLFANAAGLLLFGSAVAAVCGWGVGWLMILVCGAGGNLLTAVWYGPGHLSIGASTAVFAAVGLCSALTMGLSRRQQGSSRRAWLSIAGGLALLGFMGASPNTDVLAHLFGFGCGLACGAVMVWLFPGRLTLKGQLTAAAVMVLLVAGGWLLGMQ